MEGLATGQRVRLDDLIICSQSLWFSLGNQIIGTQND